MGLLFSKRHDFLTYEKSLEHISQLQGKLALRRSRRRAALHGYKQKLLTACYISLVPCVAWVAYLRQTQFGVISATAYFTRTAGPFVVPLVLYIASYLLLQVFLLLDRHEAAHNKKLADSKKKLIKELKDSTNFEKTMALLKKYDPEVQLAPPPALAVPSPGLRQRNVHPGGMPPQPVKASAASALLSTALDSVSTLATNLMGDNPALLEELRRAQVTAQRLQHENDMLRRQLGELCSKYDEMPVFLSISESTPAPVVGGPGSGAAAAAGSAAPPQRRSMPGAVPPAGTDGAAQGTVRTASGGLGLVGAAGLTGAKGIDANLGRESADGGKAGSAAADAGKAGASGEGSQEPGKGSTDARGAGVAGGYGTAAAGGGVGRRSKEGRKEAPAPKA